MYEIRRPLSEKNLSRYSQIQSSSQQKKSLRPSSTNQIKLLNQMKSSTQLTKEATIQESKDQKENQSIKSNINEVNFSQKKQQPKEILEYKKLQDKLSYLESKIINIKTHIDNSQRQTKQSLASRFFNQKSPTQQEQEQQSQLFTSQKGLLKQSEIITKPKTVRNDLDFNQMQNKLKSSTLLNDPRLNQNDTNLVKKPSLSTFVTQFKTTSNTAENNQKDLIYKVIQNKADTTKANQPKISFTNRKQSNDRQMPSETQFLYYISSVIRGYMTPEITKSIQQIREHLLQCISSSSFARNINLQQIEEKKINLPITSFKKTIVFDLDETLIHCNESTKIPGDVILPIQFPTGDIIEASINIRPYAQQVLQTLSRHYELIVFTASHSCYANVVIDYLDPTKQWISHRFFRESCLQTEEGAYIKDLRIIGNRQLSDIVLVDNAAYSFCLQQLNGIPILNYYDNKTDQELLYLQNYLMAMKSTKDVRHFNQQYLKLDKFTQFKDPIQLLESLFKEYIP